MAYTNHHAKYFASQITRKCASDDLSKFANTLIDAQVDLNPHQVNAALFAFNSPLSKGGILADEVGLGKTIEAGLVISQKWAEKKRKILIICPSNLRKQWSQELQDKFFLESFILETKTFNSELKNGNLNPFDQESMVISSYQFVKNKSEYVSSINWDLVVIDEAHRLRNVYQTKNKVAKAIKETLQDYPKVLLTATPLQNSLLEMYGLVTIIDDHFFGDIKSFKSQYINGRLGDDSVYTELKSRLRPVCNRTLRRQVLEYIKYTNRIPLVEEFYPTEKEQRLYELISAYLQKEELYALPSSQRKLMTLILRKMLASSTFAISNTLLLLKQRLEALLEFIKAEQEKAKQPIDDFEAKIAEELESYEELKDECLDDETESQIESEQYTEAEIEAINLELKELSNYHDLAQSIEKNAKGEKLLTALDKGFEKAQSIGANKKAIIFTESTRTQNYIFNLLNKSKYEGKVVLFNGSNNDSTSKQIYKDWLETNKGTDKVSESKTANTRQAIVDHFKNHAEIMIATEAAAEGINLQFCSLLINFDLPWNPQRIEQRIGRCHRYGQKFDVVVINFLNKKNAADQRVYELLNQKFKLFEGVFGASDEVLGSIESGIDFERKIAEIYQQCRTEKEINSAFDSLKDEFQASIEEDFKQTKQKLLENFDLEVQEKLKISQEEGVKLLSKYQDWLWMMSLHVLNGHIKSIDNEKYSFTLNDNPYQDLSLNLGPYQIGKNLDYSYKNIYRPNHKLAQKVLDIAIKNTTPDAFIRFDYSNSNRKVSALEEYIGKSGYLRVSKLSFKAFDLEEHILIAGFTNDFKEIESNLLERLFALQAELISSIEIDQSIIDKFRNATTQMKTEITQSNDIRNSKIFDEEIERLEKWADDKKLSIEAKLKELDSEIKDIQKQAKMVTELENKVKLQRKVKDLQKKRKELRLNLYTHQDEIDEQKEQLISEVEKQLNAEIKEETLFSIKWELV
ncbi:MAG: SNF2-related protein [Candidatus Caenarcaniphilales bacterium]|nr:SNF2-related protein [Candidatus Caenarcaniphilales bacterium]